jgi:benzoate/toluate 1,2-dioxygenase beta subunit
MIVDIGTQRRVEQFLYHEARLLDTGQFEAWLALYEPDGIYWIPSQPGQTDALNVASIIYEDHAILSIRVQRLLEARALVLTPMPHTAHLITNIEVLAKDAASITAGATFVCFEQQATRQRSFAGRQVFELETIGDTFRIRLKRTDLLNAEGLLAPMTIPF